MSLEIEYFITWVFRKKSWFGFTVITVGFIKITPNWKKQHFIRFRSDLQIVVLFTLFKILDLQTLFHREIPTWKKCGHNMAPEYSGLNYCGFYGTYCLLYITVEIKFDFWITSTICAMVCKSFNNFQLYLRVFFWKPIRSTNKILTFKTRIKRCGKINVCFSSFNLLKQLLYLFWGCLASSSLNKAKKLNCAGLPG